LWKLIVAVAYEKKLEKQIAANNKKLSKMTIETLCLERENKALEEASYAYSTQAQALRIALRSLKDADI